MPLSKPVFSLENISLNYPAAGDPRTVLRDLSFSLDAGEILTICGASGTGKTSLLRILGGLIRPSTGVAKLRGTPIDGPADGVALVFQDYSNALLQWRTVAGNVALGIERKSKGAVLQTKVAEALALVGLEANACDYPWQLSGGMQQRVQIARAMALRPSVLLMDEPFAALDAMTKASLQDELLKLRARTGASIVFITHDIEEAVYLGDRIAVLRGKPATFAKIFAVALAAPRHQVATRELPGFLALRREVHAAIEGAHEMG